MAPNGDSCLTFIRDSLISSNSAMNVTIASSRLEIPSNRSTKETISREASELMITSIFSSMVYSSGSISDTSLDSNSFTIFWKAFMR